MASRIGPRSVKDATRFTSTIPHASSKSASSAAPRASRIPGESPEQRVRRLRQAHLAAQKAQVSNADRVVDVSRRFFDLAHRWTVGGLVLFTAVAGVVSVYSVWDMLRYNRARRAEFLEAQKKYESDALATARLAYLKGDATEDQIALVEEANREAEAAGVKLPPLLAPPEHRTHFEEHVMPAFESKKDAKEGQGKGILGFFWGGSNTSSDRDGALGEAKSSEPVTGSVQDLTKDAWEKERQNQSAADTGKSTPTQSSKKSWW